YLVKSMVFMASRSLRVPWFAPRFCCLARRNACLMACILAVAVGSAGVQANAECEAGECVARAARAEI
ncbi:hypothetical protein N7677_32300, partial [Achromobacter xylosoxidans]